MQLAEPADGLAVPEKFSHALRVFIRAAGGRTSLGPGHQALRHTLQFEQFSMVFIPVMDRGCQMWDFAWQSIILFVDLVANLKQTEIFEMLPVLHEIQIDRKQKRRA